MSTLKVDAIRHNSATSDAITTAADGTCTAKLTSVGGGGLSHRNIVINGAMTVAQRGQSSTSSNAFTCDRFKHWYQGADEAPTFSQHALTSSDTGPWEEGFRYSFHTLNGNQTGGAGASDYIEIDHELESQVVANSGWNYLSTSGNITLSFWVKASVSQKYSFILRTKDGTSYSYLMETPTLSANTWTKVTKTIPGNSNLTFDNDTGAGMTIVWFPFIGTTYTDAGNPTETWGAFSSTRWSTPMTSTWWTTNDATFEITGVQLEVGDTATTFEHRSYGEELARCQRYYYRLVCDEVGQRYAMGLQYTSSAAEHYIQFPEIMRSKPTAIETTGTASDYAVARTSTWEVCNVVPTFQVGMVQGCMIRTNQTQASLSTGMSVMLRANTTNFFIGFSAEL